jgi:hypothetical protein
MKTVRTDLRPGLLRVSAAINHFTQHIRRINYSDYHRWWDFEDRERGITNGVMDRL